MTARRWAIALGLVAAIAFAVLAGVRLTAQGPQYDELHQAIGAFTWIGAPPAAFCLDFHGVCVLTTTYSAALKSHLYGLFLRVSGRDFDLADWRWLGILLVAASFPVFAAGAWPVLGLRKIALFFLLLLTDGSLLLFARFDGGPVALAFLLRLAMIAVWLHGEASTVPGRATSSRSALWRASPPSRSSPPGCSSWRSPPWFWRTGGVGLAGTWPPLSWA